jgi:hypothetical protein
LRVRLATVTGVVEDVAVAEEARPFTCRSSASMSAGRAKACSAAGEGDSTTSSPLGGKVLTGWVVPWLSGGLAGG